MSTERERAHLTGLALTAWNNFTVLLTDHGQTWPETDPARWPRGLHTAFSRVQALSEALDVIGGLSFPEIIRIHGEARTTANR